MSFTSIQGKLQAYVSYFILYVDSLHAAWVLHQVYLKLLSLLISIEMMVTLITTIPLVSPPLSLNSTSTLCVFV
ncbi:hypothetical protein BHM03_00049066 [Ensete ventricosum]|nr:hypothetical protein BHM03_00049066 [Ensete ventricosum]